MNVTKGPFEYACGMSPSMGAPQQTGKIKVLYHSTADHHRSNSTVSWPNNKKDTPHQIVKQSPEGQDHNNEVETPVRVNSKDYAQTVHNISESISQENTPKVHLKKTKSIIPSNIFARFFLFFHDDVDFSILPKMLEDLVERHLYSLSTILEHLKEFQVQSQFKSDANDKFVNRKTEFNCGRMFTFFVGKFLDGRLSMLVSKQHIKLMSDIVLEQEDSFEELLSDLCRTEHKTEDIFNLGKETLFSSNRMKVLTDCLMKINQGKSSVIKSVDQRLSCGEAPLKVAARFRNPQILQLLLQHGASVWSRWLCFNSAFEVLLFAPHHVHTCTKERKKIEQCLEILLRTTDSVRMSVDDTNQLSPAADFIPLLPGWQSYIPEDRYRGPCSLTQLCKINIRSALHQEHCLPQGIYTLPLPEIIKKYIDLRIP